MRTTRRPSVRLLAATGTLLAVGLGAVAASAAPAGSDLSALRGYARAHGLRPDISARTVAEVAVAGATPRARCGPGSRPETGRQGRVPAADYVSGRAAQGYTCNTVEVGHQGATGGYRVERYTDRAGRVCAFYDSTLLFPQDVYHGVAGVTVLDMSDPARPAVTDTLRTPAMQSTHESLRLNARRGLLVADMGNPATTVGQVDVYDVSGDCRHPVLRSSTPVGVLGHESGFSPDGRTFYATTTSQPGITAIDLTDPSLPRVLWRSTEFTSHGMGLSADGTRAYIADLSGQGGTGTSGLGVLDVSQVQRRVPNPVVRRLSSVTWPEVSIPQNAVPVTIRGRRYLLEFDEFDANPLSYDPASPVGAARMIDVTDEKHPRVVSRMRLEVHQPAARRSDQQDDPMATNGLQGYAAHYCSVPRQVEPGIVACSMILSGLRVFDVRDPLHPREVAYFNRPLVDSPNPRDRGSYAMSAPAFDPARREVWFTDGNSGFYAVRLTNGAWNPSGSYPHVGG